MNRLRRPMSWMRICCCAVLLAACGASKPDSFAQHFYATIAAGKTDQALDMFSYSGAEAAEMTAARGKATMIVGEMQATISKAGGLDSVQVEQVNQTDANHAKVTVTLKLGNDTQRKETLVLIREKGAWKVVI